MSGALPADASFSTPNDEWAFRTGRALGSDSNDSYFCLGTYNVAGCNPANPDTSRLEAAVILHFGSTTVRCLRPDGTYDQANRRTIDCPAGTTFKWFYSSKGARNVAQFFSPEEVSSITQSFAYGFMIGSGPDRNLTSATPYSPHLLLMIGTPNGPENMALRTGCGGIATACGGQQLWNRVVEVRRGPASIQQSYRAMIAYQNRIIVRGAIDVEQGRDAPTKFCFTPNCFAETSALTGGYTAAASADPNGSWYVNYGACDGCSEDPDALINNTNNIFTTKPTADFTHQNIGQLATYKAFVAPQLYNENARNAKQWAALSKGWNSRRVRPPIIGPPTQSSSLYFAIGIVSQTGVCNSIPAGCPGTARQGTDSVVDLETSLGQPIVRRVLNFYNSPTSL